MVVNGVNGNQKSLSVLLQQKQKKLDSIKEQKRAVQDEFTKINNEANSTKVKIGEKEVSLSDAIVALQNHPFKGMKAPDTGDVKYEIKDKDEKSLGIIDQAQFDKDMAEFKKAEAEYKALEKNVETATEELKITKDDLTKIMAEAEKVEQELANEDADYEVTMGDIESLNKQIDEAAKTKTLDVTLKKDKNNNTLVEATVNKLKVLQDQGLVDKSIDLKNLQPAQLKKLSEAIVNSDIKNKIVAADTKTDGTSEDYTKMEEGDGRTYTVAQMQEMAKALGAGAENDEAGFAITSDDLKDLKAPKDDFVEIPDGDKSTVQNKKTEIANGKIVFPRGIKWQGTEGNKLSDFGITDNGDGTYKASTGKIYTASEVNKWFREVEDSSGNNYSKYLDKAEDLGIDYNKFSSSKELKEAVKAEEKRLKAVDKYSDEIKQYGIETEGKTADQIKAAVKAAKAKAKETTKTSTKVEVQKAEAATKKDQSAVKYEVEDEKEVSIDLNALLNSHKVNQAELKTIKAESELGKAEADLKLSKDVDEYVVRKEVVQDKKEKLADARKTLSELNSSSSTSTAVEDFINDDSFEEGAKADAIFSAGTNIAFKNGATVFGETENGIPFKGKQIISGSGKIAYLINGEYYALNSNGLPDLSTKLNKADFEK